MDDNELLSSIVRWRTGQEERRQVQGIKSVYGGYAEKGLRRHRRQTRVVDLWEEILPVELSKHCRLVSLLRGVLKVEVEAGPYMFEMQNIRQPLLEQLQQKCPGAGVSSIKLIACEMLKDISGQSQQKRVKV